jgi:branched-chain amino acid transport system substrate-binding protein
MAPNYQAGKDAIAGFKRFYGKEPLEEIYTQLNQLDFQADLARIASLSPDAIYTLMPGGMGVNLVKQYSQAGLAGRCGHRVILRYGLRDMRGLPR